MDELLNYSYTSNLIYITTTLVAYSFYIFYSSRRRILIAKKQRVEYNRYLFDQRFKMQEEYYEELEIKLDTIEKKKAALQEIEDELEALNVSVDETHLTNQPIIEENKISSKHREIENLNAKLAHVVKISVKVEHLSVGIESLDELISKLDEEKLLLLEQKCYKCPIISNHNVKTEKNLKIIREHKAFMSKSFSELYNKGLEIKESHTNVEKYLQTLLSDRKKLIHDANETNLLEKSATIKYEGVRKLLENKMEEYYERKLYDIFLSESMLILLAELKQDNESAKSTIEQLENGLESRNRVNNLLQDEIYEIDFKIEQLKKDLKELQFYHDMGEGPPIIDNIIPPPPVAVCPIDDLMNQANRHVYQQPGNYSNDEFILPPPPVDVPPVGHFLKSTNNSIYSIGSGSGARVKKSLLTDIDLNICSPPSTMMS